MKNASFLSHWLDLSVNGPSGALEVRRFYNSRSAKVGIFGFGWCSKFEKNLVINEDSVTLTDCSLEKDEPVKNVQRTPAGFDIKNENEEMKFDGRGRLINIRSTDGLDIGLIYSKDKLTQLKTNDGRKLELIYDPLGKRVIEIRGSNGVKVRYKYNGDDLSAVIKKDLRAQFTYDEMHNLVRIEHPDKGYELITYDTALDRVKKYRSASGCTDSFTYKATGNNNYISAAQRQCGTQIVNRATYRFIHNPSNNAFLPVAREISSEPIERK